MCGKLEEKYGIDETLDVVKAVVALANAIDEVSQDGFDLGDVFDLIKPLSMFPAAISGAEKIPLELSDYSDEERQQVQEAVEELEFESEYSELIAEQAVRTVAELGVLLVVISKVKNGELLQDIVDFLRSVKR